MKKDKEKILGQYEKSGEIIYHATLNGDYKSNNREGAKLVRIFKLFEQDEAFAMECIEDLIKSNNVVVRAEAAAYCLALKKNITFAENVLKEISNDPANGIFGFNAKMTLKVWYEQGELRIYQK